MCSLYCRTLDDYLIKINTMICIKMDDKNMDVLSVVTLLDTRGLIYKVCVCTDLILECVCA